MKKFLDAYNGLLLAFKHKAVLIQIILGVCAILGGIIISLDYYEWLAFVICICIVLSAEIFNTSIEKIGNYLNINKDSKIKEIKDLSSAAVLIAAIGSLIICIMALLRRVKI